MKKSLFRKNVLATVIAVSLPFYASVAESATQTVTGGDVSVGSRFFNTSAADGDTYLVLVSSGDGTLTVVGNLNHRASGGTAVIGLTGGNYTINQSSGFFANGIFATGGTHGIAFSGTGTTLIGNSVLSRIIVENGNAIHIAQVINGQLEIVGTLEGATAITATSAGGLATDSKIILNNATLKTTATNVIDFSAAEGSNNGLQLEIKGISYLQGAVLGDSTDADKITVDGSAYFEGDITGVDEIVVNSQRRSLDATSDLTDFQGDISGASTITINGNARFSKVASQELSGDLSVKDGGTITVTVGAVDTDANNAAIKGLNSFVVENGANLIFAPEASVYESGTALTNAVLISSASTTVYGSSSGSVLANGFQSILFKNTDFNIDGSNNLIGSVTFRTPEEVGGAVSAVEGAGFSSEEAIARVLKTASDQALTSSAAKNAYNTIANITDIQNLAKLATESKVNNANATQEANVAASSKVVQDITHRLSSLRDDDFHSSTGYAYGDGASSQGVWVQFLNSSIDQNKSRNDDGDEVLGFNGDMSGVTLGFESDMDDYTTGLAFTMANLDTHKKNSSDKSVIKNYQVSLYGSWEQNNYFVDGVLNFGVSQHDRNRYIDGFASTPITADFTSHHYGLQFIGGMTEEFEGIQIQPMVGFNYTLITTESYTEEDNNDTGFAMQVDNQKYQKVELGAGVELSQEFQISKGELEPSLRVMAWHDFKGQQVETTSRYVIGGSDFTSKGLDAAKNSMQLSANLAYRRNDNMTFTTGYERNQKSDYQSDSFYLRMKYDF